MYEIKVSGMTCGGCVRSVTAALKSLDSMANINVNLSAQLITVESDKSRDEIESTIEEAGYTVLET
ncbi:copper chaperone [Bacteriovorax stolpii]|uniref:heavy-metal-associated domain-containing protein n=1 Tax=Bacteriovorax stolpii TaxID=960 RepID=UPI001159F431|nr:heavy-metal-associated domain-containing protein [Bacteriovorax stolpii]QDK42355.1 copper chaperone [Bacteriovorax stolpii]